jgi:hypothetical protein
MKVLRGLAAEGARLLRPAFQPGGWPKAPGPTTQPLQPGRSRVSGGSHASPGGSRSAPSTLRHLQQMAPVLRAPARDRCLRRTAGWTAVGAGRGCTGWGCKSGQGAGRKRACRAISHRRCLLLEARRRLHRRHQPPRYIWLRIPTGVDAKPLFAAERGPALGERRRQYGPFR